MPSYLRRFFIKSISEDNKKTKEEMDKRAGREDLTTKKFPGRKGKKNVTQSKPYITKAQAK